MTFRLNKAQSVQCQALAAELRTKAKALNIAIDRFNREVEPLSKAVVEAQDGYNKTLGIARTLATSVVETAQAEFDAKFERWQDGEAGTQVRNWIEHWEMTLDDVDLDLPEPLEELDPETHAGEIEDGPATPTELEDWLRHVMTLGLRR